MSKQKSAAKWQRDRAKVKAKAARVDPYAFPHCAIPGCGKPTQALQGKGFSASHCRYHIQWNARHGSFWKGTYRASELLPYKKAAERYLRDHRADKGVQEALVSVATMYRRAGSVERIVDVLVMKPADKAKAAIARLRAAEVAPERLLAIYLTIAAAIAEDPVGPGGEPRVYLRTQVGKAAHRLASGYHTDYGYHRYPRSSGLALRHIGGMVEKACEWLPDNCVQAVLDLKIAAVGPRPPGPPHKFPRSRFAAGEARRGW
ncbi:hypothetical protein BA190_27460 [Labrys sp. WJW]|uniref:hypothetical protein n=1 Tax=Labrys sp. WJW TaxID=1737983 RepID=UPI00082BFBA9|nr:hypothetical protein [Labrys sp. WJW]OCC01702.1 hypothetical protein BA190_27460 [Labrys sp. WJW]